MKRDQYVKWRDGTGRALNIADNIVTVQTYRKDGDLYEPTSQKLDIKLTDLTEIEPLPTRDLLMRMWRSIAQLGFKNRDVSIYSMLYSASEKIYERGYYILDYYTDGDTNYAIASGSDPAVLYRFGITMDNGAIQIGEPEEVVASFAPIVRTSIEVKRGKDGKYHFACIAGSATINRVGEIDSMALYRSFVEYAEETGEYPYLTVYHAGEALRCGQITRLYVKDSLYIGGGDFDDTDFGTAVATMLAERGDAYGISIGYLITQQPRIEVIEGRNVPIFERGRNVEFSVLPEIAAASKLTSIQVNYRSSKSMKKSLRDVMLDIFAGDEEQADAMLAKVDTSLRTIADQNLATRAAAEETKAKEDPEKKREEAPVEPVEFVLDDETQNFITNKVLESPAFVNLAKAVTDLTAALASQSSERAALTTRLSKLEKTDGDKIRDIDATRPAARTVKITRPSEINPEKKDTPDEELTLAERAKRTRDLKKMEE